MQNTLAQQQVWPFSKFAHSACGRFCSAIAVGHPALRRGLACRRQPVTPVHLGHPVLAAGPPQPRLISGDFNGLGVSRQ